MKLVVVGQGYVGLPLAREASAAGLAVVGLDQSAQVVESLNAGRSHIDDISDLDLASMIAAGYRASIDPAVVTDADVVVICVPTPLSASGGPDMRAVESAAHAIADNLQRKTLIVLESTTYPGTTEDLVLPLIVAKGHVLDVDFHLAFSPERIDPGNARYGLKNTPKVVGGATERSADAAVAFYSRFVDDVIRVRGTREAETAKLLENTYRHVNIALVNEMAQFCHEMDIDLWEVIDAAATKPFGFQAFYPGPGVGGHCIPIDPNYLSHEVKRRLGYPFRFVELAQEINNRMPTYVVARIQDLLNADEKALNGAKVLLLGASYKANISDSRESPSAPIAQQLVSKGAEVLYHDPRIEEWDFGHGSYRSVNLQRGLEAADVTVLLQAHVEYEPRYLSTATKRLLDTRGLIRTADVHRL